MSKKKTAKKKKATPEQLFGEWWENKAVKKVDKIEKFWLDSNEPNEDEEAVAREALDNEECLFFARMSE